MKPIIQISEARGKEIKSAMLKGRPLGRPRPIHYVYENDRPKWSNYLQAKALCGRFGFVSFKDVKEHDEVTCKKCIEVMNHKP